MNSRLAVVKILLQVTQHGRNLPDAIAKYTDKIEDGDRPLIQAMSYGVVRLYPRLEFIANQLISKPLKTKDQDVVLLILSGLYQLIEMRIPDHAAVSETVKVTKTLKKPWAKNLVNAILRNYQRQAESINNKIEKNAEAKFAHPFWWLKLIKDNWPENEKWQQILEANNQNPPMTLRLNTKHISRDNYLNLLKEQEISATAGKYSPDAIYLKTPVQVNLLPLFAEGKVSVQDEAAQLAAILLNPQKGDHILDACAAPGGKTIHLLEREKEIDLLALDIEENRLEKVQENLNRTHLNAQLLAANAFKPDEWWDKKPFDRILLDAPCSASGVIRRHPDIKLLRHQDDIPKLVQDQQQILNALWPLLKSGGMLLYATCSVLAEENTLQIQHFLQHHADAELHPINSDWGQQQVAGKQILPGNDGENGMDGFFYALIQKQ
ncbi:MAG: 16S rRNA (cytosine(967)-C(5))-methyltransferase RsmB [Gammaproteobacteria bacterium]|nr:16S rRNA (cytosine(967)-C(5))-methyltransferase RsmB [Gammaproteobacteria bacterium]MDH5660383.1 16S rRNA (cytosine(967)-C(5))-methyltransferase RsmB [Gammaproteobacteria bacterium]